MSLYAIWFGGPIAHLDDFRDEFVTRQGWLSERSYADLVALCQFGLSAFRIMLPGSLIRIPLRVS